MKFSKNDDDTVKKGNYRIHLEYINDVLPPFTQVVGLAN